MKAFLIAIFFFLIVANFFLLFASSDYNPGRINIKTVDGTISGYPQSLIFLNGCLQDNGNNTFTVICGSSTPSSNPFLLLETNDYLLLEDSTKLIVQ